jgi:hypothetical protein
MDQNAGSLSRTISSLVVCVVCWWLTQITIPPHFKPSKQTEWVAAWWGCWGIGFARAWKFISSSPRLLAAKSYSFVFPTLPQCIIHLLLSILHHGRMPLQFIIFLTPNNAINPFSQLFLLSSFELEGHPSGGTFSDSARAPPYAAGDRIPLRYHSV